MNYDKLFGYLLLVIGIVIIGWMFVTSFNIFTGKNPVPDLFKEEVTIQNNSNNKVSLDNLSQENMQEYVSQSVKEGIGNVLPDNFMNKTLNLICWGAFAGISVLVGGKLGNLGINLITKSKKSEAKEG